MQGKLYIVATPIGNGEDMTGRAKRILGEVDIVAAEDTRTVQGLFRMLGIQNRTISNHKFNERNRSDYLVSMLEQGKDVAVVSEAGTPCISDPGHAIVKAAVEKGIDVISVCGASAVIAALSVSGFDVSSFAFYGFFPRGINGVTETLRKATGSGIPVSVFFESPRRIAKTLGVIAAEAPEAELCLCNDLTKAYEKIYRGAPRRVQEEVACNSFSEKGEYTLVMHAKAAAPPATQKEVGSREAMIMEYIVKNGGTLKEAVQALQERHKGQIPRSALYRASLRLKKMMEAIVAAETGRHSGGGQ